MEVAYGASGLILFSFTVIMFWRLYSAQERRVRVLERRERLCQWRLNVLYECAQDNKWSIPKPFWTPPVHLLDEFGEESYGDETTT